MRCGERRRRSGAVGLAAGVVAAVVGLAVVAPASAYVETRSARVNTVMVENPTGHIGDVRATLVLEDLRAGEVRLLRAQSVTTRGTPDRNAVGQKITCETPGGRILLESWGGTNLLEARGPALVTQRLLFTAPADGTYHCNQRVYVDSHYLQPAKAVLRTAFVSDVLGPVDPARVAGTGLTRGNEYFSAADPSPRRVLAVSRYRPPPDATRLTVRTDVFVTSCYGPGGAGCPLGSFPRSGVARYTVQSHLVPSNPRCARVSSARRTVAVDHLLHHLGFPVDLSTAIPAGGSCGSWSSYLTVRHLSGLPFVVHRYPYSQSAIFAD